MKIKTIKNGSLHITGEDATLINDQEKTIKKREMWLCRCGASKNKPFCDGSHKTVGFTDEQ